MATSDTTKLDREDEKVLADDDNLQITPAQNKFGDVETNIQVQEDLGMLVGDLDDVEAKLGNATLEWTHAVIQEAYRVHLHDANFPGTVLDSMEVFLNDPNVLSNPDKHEDLIKEMKMEAILSTENSPYQEVRANVENTDDPTMPSLTFRVLFIGTVFSGAGSFIDTLFLLRQPSISVGANVAQMLAYPCGRFLARVMPRGQFSLFGRQMSFNPGPFGRKEHMLITIMASVSFSYPYTAFLIPTQALPMFFNEEYARHFGYQFLCTAGINMVGFGLAGLFRRFLVFPSWALWPSSLATIALNKSFHTEQNEPVNGPFGWVYRRSRNQAFFLCFGAMFIWFFFPGYIFQALSVFNWLSWIAPNNVALNSVVGFNNGVGLNPWPTFDWNNLTAWLTPLTIPTFSIVSQFIGICIGTIMSIGFYFTNAWNSSYLPINSNASFDNQGNSFNVSKILGSDQKFDNEKYQQYSQPWMSAGFCCYLIWYFAMYGATLSYICVYHRHEVVRAFKTLVQSINKTVLRRRNNVEADSHLSEDVHFHLMKAYPEVPEWWYLIVLVVAAVLGMLGVGLWPTNTSPVVVIYGIIMPLIAILPCGIVQAVTGIAIPLQVLAQFIGGSFSGGSGIALMFFKSYGYISMYQALLFCNDLKLGHYIHIAPRHVFTAQILAVTINTFVASAIFNFQMSFRDICTPQAQFKLTCPGPKTFYTGAVFWGVLGPDRLFGPGKRYNLLLLGFPIGILIPIAHYLIRRARPRSEWIRQIHPVMICAGPANWGSPYNFSYFWPNVMVAWFSFQYIRKRYTAFWAKYNYIVAAAFPAGIAVAGLVIFFALELPKEGTLSIDWWGNTVSYEGCEGAACRRFEIPEVGYFGPAPGTNSFT